MPGESPMSQQRESSTATERLATVRSRIEAACRQAGRNPDDVKLIAVGKTKPAAVIAALADAGLVDFGENYVQEATEKIASLDAPGLTWHFIGHIQSNKCADVAKHFDWVHTVDRAKIARRLDAAAARLGRSLNVLIQVNVDEEAGKSGVLAHELPDLVEEVAALPALVLRGLMTIPAPVSGQDAQRRPFAQLRRLLESVRSPGDAMDCLSMGMSADLEAAIAEGATHVRVGTALFGPRQY